MVTPFIHSLDVSYSSHQGKRVLYRQGTDRTEFWSDRVMLQLCTTFRSLFYLDFSVPHFLSFLELSRNTSTRSGGVSDWVPHLGHLLHLTVEIHLLWNTVGPRKYVTSTVASDFSIIRSSAHTEFGSLAVSGLNKTQGGFSPSDSGILSYSRGKVSGLKQVRKCQSIFLIRGPVVTKGGSPRNPLNQMEYVLRLLLN